MYISFDWSDMPVYHLKVDAALNQAYATLTGSDLDYSRPEAVHIQIFVHPHDDGPGFTYSPDEDGVIDIEIYNAEETDWELTIAHELVHAAQLLAGMPLCENQAYSLETEIKQTLLGI